MKNYTKFIWKVIAFMGVVLLVVAVIWNIVIFTRSQTCHCDEKTILVLGNSRIRYGVDDSNMCTIWNVGLDADNYNLIYWKLKILHKYNRQLQKVILQVDQTILFHYEPNVEYKLHPYYWDVMGFMDWWYLLEKDRNLLMNPFDWVKIAIPIKSLFTAISFQDLGIGGYTILDRDELNECLVRESENKTIVSHRDFDNLQLDYLNKIVKYCYQNNICIEFVSMPSYHTTNLKYGHSQVNEYIHTYFSNIKYYDYEFMELPDSCYGDLVHLNYKGANALKKKLKDDFCRR